MLRKTTMALCAFLYSGQTAQAWRHPAIDETRTLSLDYYVEYAQLAEAVGFDALFLADSSAVPHASPQILASLWSVSQLEPVTLMAALAGRTSRIGLVLTASVADTNPYLLARQIASLDHISHGRAGWNIVTTEGPGSAAEAVNATLTRDNVYERAGAFLDVVRALWQSQPSAALVRDKRTGVFSNPELWNVPSIDNGFYSAHEPLRIGTPPQGVPLLAQAGSSPIGRDFGARHADLMFCSALDLASARNYRSDVKARAASAGRDPCDLIVMVGKGVVWGETRAQAEDRLDQIAKLHPLSVALQNLGIDFGNLGPDELFPLEVEDPETGNFVPIWSRAKKSSGRAEVIARHANSQRWTIAQTAQNLAASLTHGLIAGTTTEIADHFEEWFDAGAADGFAIQSPMWIEGFRDVTRYVVPELVRRGLFNPSPKGATLRERLRTRA